MLFRVKDRPLMEWDEMESDMVVVGGREGCLQWIHPATSTSPFIVRHYSEKRNRMKYYG